MADSSKIALEMLHVDCVEADDRGVHPDVELRHVLAEKIWTTIRSQHLLKLVEGTEDGDDVLVVDFLVGCESGFVDTAVEIPLHPF